MRPLYAEFQSEARPIAGQVPEVKVKQEPPQVQNALAQPLVPGVPRKPAASVGWMPSLEGRFSNPATAWHKTSAWPPTQRQLEKRIINQALRAILSCRAWSETGHGLTSAMERRLRGSPKECCSSGLRSRPSASRRSACMRFAWSWGIDTIIRIRSAMSAVENWLYERHQLTRTLTELFFGAIQRIR